MAGYIGSSAAVSTPGTERKKTFAITTTTTSLTGLVYTVNFVHVYHNGIRLVDGTDFTATNSTSITLVNAAENGDEVVVVSYATFSPADSVPSTGGTFSGDVNFGANATFGDNDKAIFGAGSDLQIYHDGDHSFIKDTGTGDLYIRGSNNIRLQSNSGETYLIGELNGPVYIRHNDVNKLATTSTGVDITGTLTSDGLTVGGNITANANASATYAMIRSSDTGVASVYFGNQSDAVTASIAMRHDDGNALQFNGYNNTERMRIDSSGNVGVGVTTIQSSVSGKTLETSGCLLVGGNLAAHQTNRGVFEYQGNVFQMRAYGASAGQGQITFRTGGGGGSADSEAMRIDSSGNVGIGVAPTGYLTSGYNLRLNGGSQTYLTFNNTTYSTQATGGFVVGFDNDAARITQRENKPMIFGTNNAERMRIGSGGDFLVGTPSLITGGGVGIGLQTAALGAYLSRRTSTTSNNSVALFYNPNGLVGAIKTNGSSTSYNTSSDYRLKTDAQPMTGASARVQALNPVNFEWLSDGSRVDGFLAHEAQAVVPEAVHGTKDAMMDEEYEVTPAVEATYDDEGNELTAAVDAVMGTRSVPDYQGIDQSKLVPLLTAALQEALTKIDDMETRLAALEGN